MVLIPKNAVLKVFDSSFKICDNEYLCFNVKTIKQPQSISSFLIVLKYFRFNFGFSVFWELRVNRRVNYFNCTNGDVKIESMSTLACWLVESYKIK